MGETAGNGSEGLGPGISTFLGAVRIQFLVAVLTGVVLSIGYSPRTITAHANVAHMHQGLLRPLQGLHYWVSALLILESLGLVIALIWTGRYRRPFGGIFNASVLLLLSALAFQITGNLLPFDRHGVETVVIETGIAARAPVLGAALQRFLLQGPGFGPETLRLWYLLHFATGLLLLAALVLGWIGRKRLASDRLNGPVVAAISLVPFLLALLVSSPFGSAASPPDAYAFGARVSWYTWPLHGSLVMLDRLHQGSGWIGAILIPGLLVLVAFLLPWIGSRIPLAIVRTTTVLVLAFYLGAGYFFAGSFAPLVGTRDPAPVVATPTGNSAPIDQALARQGEKLFQSAGCVGCHGQNGDAGGAGPSLKSIGMQHPDPGFYLKYVRQPQAVNPQSTMPAFPNLSQDELRALAEFLRAKR